MRCILKCINSINYIKLFLGGARGHCPSGFSWAHPKISSKPDKTLKNVIFIMKYLIIPYLYDLFNNNMSIVLQKMLKYACCEL